MKNIIKKISMILTTLVCLLNVCPTQAHAIDFNELDPNCPHKNVYKGFNQGLPCGAESFMDDYMWICQDCGGLIKQEQRLHEAPVHGASTWVDKNGKERCNNCGEVVVKEEVPLVEESSNNENVIKEQRQYLIDNGLNNRENNKMFEVYDENGNLFTGKINVNDPIDTDQSGICNKIHRVVGYYMYQGNQLVFVSQCLDCLDQRITNVNKVKENMNILGQESKEEVKTFKIVSEEELREIARQAKLESIKEAIKNLE